MSFGSLIGGVGALILALRNWKMLTVLAVEVEAGLVETLSSDLGRIGRVWTEEGWEGAEEGLAGLQGHYSAFPFYCSAFCRGSN